MGGGRGQGRVSEEMDMAKMSVKDVERALMVSCPALKGERCAHLPGVKRSHGVRPGERRSWPHAERLVAAETIQRRGGARSWRCGGR
jgi:hypothetical protein